jgi:hypothetical protein
MWLSFSFFLNLYNDSQLNDKVVETTEMVFQMISRFLLKVLFPHGWACPYERTKSRRNDRKTKCTNKIPRWANKDSVRQAFTFRQESYCQRRDDGRSG